MSLVKRRDSYAAKVIIFGSICLKSSAWHGFKVFDCASHRYYTPHAHTGPQADYSLIHEGKEYH